MNLAHDPEQSVTSRRARDAKRERDARADARRRKLCQLCKRRPSRPARTTCVECHKAQQKSRRKLLREQTERGLCARGRCPNPRTVGTLCGACHAAKRSFPSHGVNVTTQRRGAEGLCRDGCGRTAIDRSRCQECLDIEGEKARQRRADRVAAGLCYRCGRHEAPPDQGCASCVQRRRSPSRGRRVKVTALHIRCGACGEVGHRKSARRCPKWRSSGKAPRAGRRA